LEKKDNNPTMIGQSPENQQNLNFHQHHRFSAFQKSTMSSTIKKGVIRVTVP
jgi:hypothetical protein